MRIKAVFFDFGGTLVDTPPQYDYETSLRQLHRSLLKNGVSVTYKDYKNVHIEIRDRIYSSDSLKETVFGERISEALNRFGYCLEPTDKTITEATEAFMEPWIQARTMKKHVPSVLRTLKTKYKLGVISNFGYSQTVQKTLERFDLDKFFDAIVVSADVGWRKPSPKIFKKALLALGVSAERSVFVGDELDHDIEGAKKVDIFAILLKKSSAKEQPRQKVEPDATIHELKELPPALESLESVDANSPKCGQRLK